MKKQRLGIYLDSDGVAGAVVEGKDLISSVFIPYSLVSEDKSSQKDDSKITTEALLKRVVSELNTDINKAQISISDQKTIFRYLNLPVMTNKEIKLALPLEVEKYIPFKIENVVWNYISTHSSERSKLKVAFLGIRRDVWEDTVEIFKNVHMKIKSMESGSFAALSAMLKLNAISKKEKNFVVFILSSYGGEVTIFSDRFPYFNRHTKLPLTGENTPDVSKIGDELRLTLDYYRREFGDRKLNKLILIGSQQDLQYYSGFSEKTGLSMEKLSIEGLFDGRVSTTQELKAYFTAMDSYRDKKLYIDLLAEEVKRIAESQSEQSEETALPEKYADFEAPWDFKPLIIVVLLGFFIFGAVFFWQIHTKNTHRLHKQALLEEISLNLKDLGRLENGLPTVSDLERERDQVLAEYDYFKRFESIGRNTTQVLSFVLEGVITGMWFDRINFKRNKQLNDYTLSIQGFVYLGDTQEESESLNSFISYLNTSDFLKAESKSVELSFVRKASIDDYRVTEFKLTIQ
jgi:hypothetical protein